MKGLIFMTFAIIVVAFMALVGLSLIFGIVLPAFIIELFKDKEIMFGLFVLGLWLVGIAYIVGSFIMRFNQ